jgi:hypothetical protein
MNSTFAAIACAAALFSYLLCLAKISAGNSLVAIEAVPLLINTELLLDRWIHERICVFHDFAESNFTMPYLSFAQQNA